MHAAVEPSAMGKYDTSSAYFYVGGFKGEGVQDAYIAEIEEAAMHVQPILKANDTAPASGT